MSTVEIRAQVEGVIRQRLQEPRIRLQHTEWGWVVEVVHAAFGDIADERYQQISMLFGAIESVLREQGDIVWKLCTAKDELASFNTRATLRTIPSGFDERGVWTSTLVAADAYVQITEFDADLLFAGATKSVHAIESRALGNTPLLPYKPNTRYRTFEFHGEQHEVVSTNLATEQDPRRIEVHLGERMTGGRFH